MGVLGYQALIGGIIISSGFFGKARFKLVMLVAVVWTLAHVYIPWLMFLQFVTIFISGGIGFDIASRAEKYSDAKK